MTRRGRSSGFTLMELMVVVSIVGVLSVVAYEGYHKYAIYSHTVEANNMLSGIKNREENYRAEVGAYLSDATNSLAKNQSVAVTDLFPMCAISSGHLPGREKVMWPNGASCTASCCPPWQKLKVNSTAATFYGYSVVAGPSGSVGVSVAVGATSNVLPSTSTGPWFVATGIADTDGNGTFTTSMISSLDNEIHVDKENE